MKWHAPLDKLDEWVSEAAGWDLDANSSPWAYLAQWLANAVIFTFICGFMFPIFAVNESFDWCVDRYMNRWRIEKWVPEERWYSSPKSRLVWKDAYSFATCEEAMEFAMRLKQANVYAWRIRYGKNIIPLDIL